MAIKNGTNGADTLNGTSSNDTLNGKQGNDVLNGFAGNDTLNGNEGNDHLFGSFGNDILNGSDGNDILNGGVGKDTLTGGTGADTFRYLDFSDSKGSNVDLIKDFKAGQGDKLDLTALGTATLQSSYDASFSGLQAVFKYNAATNVTTLSYYDGSSTAVFQVKFTGNVAYSETAFLGISTAPPEPPETPGAATVTQVTDHSVTVTFDVPEGATSLHVFYTIFQDGTSTTSEAFITENLGDPITFTGDNFDSSLVFTLTYAAVNDAGESAPSTAVFVTPLVQSTPNDDFINGTPYADLIDLGPGNDQFFGGAGNDIIDGGNQNIGGKDTVGGGFGNDTFVFNSFGDFAFSDFITPGDYLTALSGADRITDFTPGEDKIDLSGLDPNFITPADEAFTFVASFVANGQAQVMVVQPIGAPPNNYLALLDRDGDGTGDYAIAVVSTGGVPTGLDFIL